MQLNFETDKLDQSNQIQLKRIKRKLETTSFFFAFPNTQIYEYKYVTPQ